MHDLRNAEFEKHEDEDKSYILRRLQFQSNSTFLKSSNSQIDHFSNGAFLKSSISQIEHFSNGAILKSNISQMEQFSNGAFWGRHPMPYFKIPRTEKYGMRCANQIDNIKLTFSNYIDSLSVFHLSSSYFLKENKRG